MDSYITDSIENIIKSEKLSKDDKEFKCKITLKPAGNAPIIAKNKMFICGSFRVSVLITHIKNILGNTINENDSIFLYTNTNFSPSLDSYIGDLYRLHSIKDELVFYYALTEVWG